MFANTETPHGSVENTTKSPLEDPFHYLKKYISLQLLILSSSLLKTNHTSNASSEKAESIDTNTPIAFPVHTTTTKNTLHAKEVMKSSIENRFNELKGKLDNNTLKNIEELAPNPKFHKKVLGFLVECYEKGYPIEVVDAARTKKEQKENVRKGYSKTMNSLHLSLQAIDIRYKGSPHIPLEIRKIGANNGLYSGAEMWGGWDEPHFQDIPTIKQSKEVKTLLAMKQRGTLPDEIYNA